MIIHNNKLGNQILSLLMALVMVISMLPMSSFTAFAADATDTNTTADTTYPYAVVDTAAGTVTIDGTLGGNTTATMDDITALVDAIKGYVDSGITTITVTGSEPALYNFYDVYTPAVSVAIFRLTEDSESSVGSGDPDSPYCGKIDLILQDVTEIVEMEFNISFALNSITLPKVTKLGAQAFALCNYLQTITFGSVVTEGIENGEQVFSSVGSKVDGGLCNLVLSCGQVNAATEYQPDIVTNEWWKTPWKHITVKHTPAENATYTDNGDGTHSFTCSICSNTITEYHSGGEATCTAKAVCTYCDASYGEVDSDNHTAEPAYTVNEFDSTQHDAYYSCCGTTVTEDHSGGTATCAHGKICEKCGSEYGEVDTTKHDSSVAFNEKGFCPNCGEYEPATLIEDTESAYNGYYEIGNAGQLFWFAEQINSGAIAKDVNAILIDNIDMDGIDWTPICSTGLYYDKAYTSSYDGVETGYDGIFDGDGYVIKNLSVTAIANETWTYGLFGTMTGTVKNLGIEGFTYNHNGATDMRTGAIVGQNLGGTIENCYVVKATITPGTNVAGGITGCNYEGTIKNCYVADSNVLASASSSTIRYGYIAGDNRADTAGDRVGTIENCYTDGDRLVGSYTGTETNSKYGVNYNYFTNGGVVWYLNGQSADGIWKQGETHPNFTGTAVTQSLLSTYTQPEIKDGVYQIKTESELRWFAEYVNFTDASVSAVLANDIAMTGDNWIPIGMYGTPFTGTFNGQGYSITGFAMTITEGGRFGLFGEISGATVKNFSIDGEVTANLPSQQTFYYGVIGASANSTITDIHSSVGLKVKDSFDKNGIAGIVASITTTTIERCSFSGTLDIGTAYIDCAGGIVGYAGWNNTHVIRDCAFYGKIVAKHESSDKTSSGQIGGILGYYRGSNITIESCLSVGTFDVANTTFTGMIGGRVLQMGADNISKVSNNYYYGNLPAFSDTEDSTHGYWNADMADYEGYGDTNAASVTTDQLKSGEIAIKLGEGWGQDLDNGVTPYDTAPNVTGAKVYQTGEGTYSNYLPGAVAQVGDQQYTTLQAAVDAANGAVVALMKDTDQSVTVTADTWLDLNGFRITGTVTVTSGTLYGIDSSATKTAAGTGCANITGTVAADHTVNGTRYVALNENGVYTFHTLELKLTAVTLRAAAAGIYYKAVVECDPVLSAAIGSYGVALSLEDMPGADFASDKNTSYAQALGTPVSGETFTSGSVFGIFKEGLEDNAARGEMKIYANAYLKLTDGTVLMSDRTAGDKTDDDGFDGTAWSLRDVMAALDAGYSEMDAAQQATLKSFYTTWASAMSGWDLTALAAATAQ